MPSKHIEFDDKTKHEVNGDDEIVTSIPEYPVTQQRKPFNPSPDSPLRNPGTARANIAATESDPHGTTKNSFAQRRQHQTVLQQHCSYWDPDNDGIIWPQDTYIGCRKYGWNPLLSLLATLIINLNLSYPTCPTILPDPLFRIYLSRIHKDKHGSDSMTYDNEGRFRPQNFEDLFSKYSSLSPTTTTTNNTNNNHHEAGPRDGLKFPRDIWAMHKGQRMVFDFWGWGATMLEWLAVWLLIWPKDNVLRREEVRGVYDGSYFFEMAERHERAWRQGPKGWGKGGVPLDLWVLGRMGAEGGGWKL